MKTKWPASLSFRKIFYVLAGIALLIPSILNKDAIMGIFSILFLAQGVFDFCLFGACRVSGKNRQ